MENYERIPAEKFTFVQADQILHDKKLQTKARSYFADAMIRFRKNKSSVVAAFILAFLILFALIVPIVSTYSIKDKDPNGLYTSFAPYVPAIAEKKLGIFDGAYSPDSANEYAFAGYKAIGIETGMDPIISIDSTTSNYEIIRGQKVEKKFYKLTVNQYFSKGIIVRTFSRAQYDEILAWQNESGIRVIYPWVESTDICGMTGREAENTWYKVKDETGKPEYDANGDFIPAYSTDKTIEAWEYTGKRFESDDGSYIYARGKAKDESGKYTSCQLRICYYNYYIFKMGHEPSYVFGTDSYGRDLFTAIGCGARFSLIFALIVSVINMFIGAIYGAIMGYYGGVVDLIMDRIIDILDGLPFIVCTTLFQLHLAQKVGVVPAFLFAFVLTGWTGMASLVRKQFYRFKGQEYVMAAKTLGASDKRLIFKHIFPNSLGTIITSCALIIPGVISSETNLTYLGIINLADFSGTSIGELMALGQAGYMSHPHSLFFPALFVSLLLICFNLFGNGLRDAFNPSNRGVED